jgi:hypothetical protein
LGRYRYHLEMRQTMLKAEMQWVEEIARMIAREEIAKALAELAKPIVVEPEVEQAPKKKKSAYI